MPEMPPHFFAPVDIALKARSNSKFKPLHGDGIRGLIQHFKLSWVWYSRLNQTLTKFGSVRDSIRGLIRH